MDFDEKLQYLRQKIEEYKALTIGSKVCPGCMGEFTSYGSTPIFMPLKKLVTYKDKVYESFCTFICETCVNNTELDIDKVKQNLKRIQLEFDYQVIP